MKMIQIQSCMHVVNKLHTNKKAAYLIFVSEHPDRISSSSYIMPHILVTTQIRLEAGPCIVGDEHSDPGLMKYLKAEQRRENGQFFKVNCHLIGLLIFVLLQQVWETKLLPREVLDLLELKGFNVVSTTGIGQTYVVTLQKPLASNAQSESC